jgi:lysozyme family protein
MHANFSAALDFMLLPANDGQPYHVSPGDNGGATAWGVTRATWSRWIGRPASNADMQALTAASTTGMYRCWYWNTVSGDSLPSGLDLMTFDAAVLGGEATAAMQLQALVGADQDGQIGPLSLAAIQQHDPTTLINRLQSAQEQHYRSLSTFAEFGNGWLARLDRRTTAALALLSTPIS